MIDVLHNMLPSLWYTICPSVEHIVYAAYCSSTALAFDILKKRFATWTNSSQNIVTSTIRTQPSKMVLSTCIQMVRSVPVDSSYVLNIFYLR